MFQLTAARRRLVLDNIEQTKAEMVSTHSRPKAAGFFCFVFLEMTMFQLTAARRRLELLGAYAARPYQFQLTAARRRLGVWMMRRLGLRSFNSQPPEGGWYHSHAEALRLRRFNSQPPEGGWCRR